jgi:hypothetical protein
MAWIRTQSTPQLQNYGVAATYNVNCKNNKFLINFGKIQQQFTS